MRHGFFALLGFILFATFSAAGELRVDHLALPFFSPDGKLSHRLTAEHGWTNGADKRLEGVRIVYFSPDDPTKVTLVVTTERAFWPGSAQILRGDGLVTAEAGSTTLQGEGFVYNLTTSVLRIERAFRLTKPGYVLTSDSAVADLVVDRTGRQWKYRDIRRCEAIDHVHLIVAQPTEKMPFRTADTDLAIYDGMEETISFPHPILLQGTKGEKLSSNSGVYSLRAPATH